MSERARGLLAFALLGGLTLLILVLAFIKGATS